MTVLSKPMPSDGKKISKKPTVVEVSLFAKFQPKKSFRIIYGADQFALTKEVKRGVDAVVVGQIAESMRLPKEFLYSTLGIPRSSVQRKQKAAQLLSSDETSRVLGLTRLIGQVEAMVQESGDPAGFDAATWVATWLDTKVPALGWRKPSEFMDTAEGQTLVSQTVARMQSGAYA